MAQATHHRFTFDEYVRLEVDSGVKHEFVAGQVFAMSGGTPERAGITANIGRLLGNALEGRPCRVFSPDLRVRVRATGLGTYPDIAVICGKQIESLREVMLVAHDRREVEIVRREGDGSWSRHVTSDGAVARLESLDCDLPVAEIYRNPLGR